MKYRIYKETRPSGLIWFSIYFQRKFLFWKWFEYNSRYDTLMKAEEAVGNIKRVAVS